MNVNINKTGYYRRKMTDFAKSFIRSYEEIYFYKDLRTWREKYLNLVVTGIITFILIGGAIYLYGDNKDKVYLIGAIVIFVIGLILIVALWLTKRKPELILTNHRLIYVTGTQSDKDLQEAPYNNINGMNFKNTRKVSPVITGVFLILIGFLTVYMSIEENSTEGYIIGGILFFIGLLIALLLGFSFSYVFKISGGNIIIPCGGRKNRENANIINSIVMDMREFGEWKHRPMRSGRQYQQKVQQEVTRSYPQPLASPAQTGSSQPPPQLSHSRLPASPVQSGSPQPPFPPSD